MAVFEDPLTKDLLEGSATLVRRVKNMDRHDAQAWEVRFEHEDETVVRWFAVTGRG